MKTVRLPLTVLTLCALCLSPAGLHADEHVYAYAVALKSSDNLRDGPEGKAIKVHEGTSFAWVDLMPEARFAHPTLYILMRGNRATVVEGKWWPVLNGEKVLYGVASPLLIKSSRKAETHKKKKAEKSSVKTIVVPSKGVSSFTVTGRSTLFRLTVSVISGGTISEPKIDGPVKHLCSVKIKEVNEKGQSPVGVVTKEFLFRGTAAGKVTIKFKKTLPTQSEPVTEEYAVTIE